MTRDKNDQVRTDRRRFLRNAAGGVTAAGAVLAVSHAYGQLPAPADRQLRAAGVNYRDIQKHHNAHVAELLSLLGVNARPKPTFQNLAAGTVSNFYSRSTYFENFYVAANIQICGVLDDPLNLDSALSMSFIVARHAGWLNTVMAFRLTSNSARDEQDFEGTFTQTVIVNGYNPFIASLNGGDPLAFNPTTPSAANDIDALNFQLAIAYLHQDFYNLNVPLFFPAP
jgi:hypothetical protein